ncbi:MAG: polyprenyl synthetase family protein [Anaerolineae bacterium]
MTKTIAIFNLIQDDLEQVEQKMREKPRLTAGFGLPGPTADKVEYAPHPTLDAVIDHLIESGGKRVRPALALLVSHIYPAKPEQILALAAAVELLHTATLVHDDLIDGALLRRGNPTLNAIWSPGATVLTGDYLYARAADLAAQIGHMRVMRLFAHTLIVICSGEIKQMFDKHISLDRQQYYERIYAKTAALFAVATEAAGILGNAPEPIVDALREYGKQVGMAFQIVDDVLDFVGDEEKMGKPVGSDLHAGLVTLPTLCFIEQNGDHELVNRVLNNGRLNDATRRAAVKVVCESGAIEAALDEARQFVRRSQQALLALPPSEYRDALWQLGDFVVDRSR